MFVGFFFGEGDVHEKLDVLRVVFALVVGYVLEVFEYFADGSFYDVVVDLFD